jgi:RimJ/RimL family protein N-acetyltransferase
LRAIFCECEISGILLIPVDVFLETERLLLRRFTTDDVDLIFELDSDPDVMRYITGGLPTPREEIETDALPAWLSYYERFTGFGFWAAHEKSTGTFIGWFHFRAPPDHAPDDVELGYRLRKSAWSKGYATEGSRALIDKGFRYLSVQRVFASTMAVNAASRRVMEKAGLLFVRTYYADWPARIEGDEHGDVEYALTRTEWETQQSYPGQWHKSQNAPSRLLSLVQRATHQRC